MSVRSTLTSVVLVILIVASSAADIGTIESTPVKIVPDGLRKIEESFVQILGQSRHVLSFACFTHKYGKRYENEEEIKHRFSVFKENLDLIRSTNNKGLSYKLGVNQFADLTNQEFLRNKFDAARFATLESSHNLTENVLLETTPPSAKDWREYGIVSPVRDQGQCEASWAISSVGAVEAAYHRQYRILISLSEQQLLDCSTNNGCDGGSTSTAFPYILEHGLILRAVYPYEGRQGACRHQLSVPRVLIKNYVVDSPGENKLKQMVESLGPVTTGFHVANSFVFYKSGVYTSRECGNTIKDLNHFMLVVGYGVEEGVPYWLIQNSWGTGWGDKGYIKVEMGKNMCGVAAYTAYPILS